MTEEETIKNAAERLGFFFSNANLRMDRFLRREVLDPNNDGKVSIEVLLRFNTIKSITEDPKLIAKAAKLVTKPKLQLSDDESAISRVEPFTEDMMDGNVEVTLRVSNLPMKDLDNGDAEYEVSRDELSALFQEYGDVAMVRLLKSKMRGSENRVAVGRAFVEFHSVEDMEKAVSELCTEKIEDESVKPKKTLSIKGSDLRVKTMQQWLDKKQAQREEKGIRGPGPKSKSNNNGNKRKAKAEETAKAALEEIEFKLDWNPGCVVSIKGLPDDCDREAILAAVRGSMGDDVPVRADYSRGQKDGAVRFDQPSEKISILAAEVNEGKITVNGTKVESASVLEGDDEKKYYDDYIAFRTKQMRANAEEKQKRKKRRGGRQ